MRSWIWRNLLYQETHAYAGAGAGKNNLTNFVYPFPARVPFLGTSWEKNSTCVQVTKFNSCSTTGSESQLTDTHIDENEKQTDVPEVVQNKIDQPCQSFSQSRCPFGERQKGSWPCQCRLRQCGGFLKKKMIVQCYCHTLSCWSPTYKTLKDKLSKQKTND